MREAFPILSGSTYLNTCSLGALARPVREAVEGHLDAWDRRGASAWYDEWLATLERARGAFAELIGAHHEEVALAPNVSTALSTIASGIDWEERGRVVSTELDFPTVAHQFHARREAELELVASPDGVQVPAKAIEGALTDDTAALVTSQVFFTSGAIQDIARLSAVANEHDALSIVDAYQATGQLETNVNELGCDVLITGGLKWLLGGTGIAYLYVSRAAQDRLDPSIAGWFGDTDPFAFDPSAYQPRPDARRFELGTPSVPSVAAGLAGMEIISSLTPARIRERQTELTTDLYERLDDEGYSLATPREPDERAGIVMIEVDDPAGTVERLANQGIIVDHRPGRVRVSPYFYNTPDEMARFVDALVEHTTPVQRVGG